MNQLNGPYSYGLQPAVRGDMWEVHDAQSNVVAICESSHYAQQVAAAMTDAWKREIAAIEVAEAQYEAFMKRIEVNP
jgi:hypothetical protein